jgi:hypothetical protein
VHNDLWVPYYFGGTRQWVQLRDNMMTRGLDARYTYENNYRDRINNTWKWAMNALNVPLESIFSVKEVHRHSG